MKTLSITPLSQVSEQYKVIIGKSLLTNINSLFNASDYSNVAIISDRNIKIHMEKLVGSFTTKPYNIILDPGEKNKNLKNLELIWKKLSYAKFDRKSLIINLGGGVICDIGGFAASTYMRGIDFINVPSTLLSQVDASIGGKTGIDFAGIKNLIGTFRQPKTVIIDVETLSTLPKREFISGLAEIIKHALIYDNIYFKKVTSKAPEDFSPDELIEIIHRSVDIKKDVVQKDPDEKSVRKILNFGHTIGHAIEAISLDTKSPLLHGEAISIGMVAEAEISRILKFITTTDVELIKKSLITAGLPVATKANFIQILNKIKQDKKNSKGSTKWALLKKIGSAVYDINVDEVVVKSAIESIS